MRQISLAIFTFFFAINSFAKTNSWDDLILRWMSVQRIEFSEYVKNEEPIKNPAGATIVLARLILLNENFSYEKDCLVYSVPSKQTNGKLSIINIGYEKKCEDYILTNKSQLYEFDNIYNLAISYKKRDLILDVDMKKYHFKFFNYLDTKKPQLLDTSATLTQIPGVQISFVTPSSNSFLKNGEICFDVDDRCKVLKDECFRCSGAVYPAIASNCKEQVRRYCGDSQCGIKGAPACIRGFSASGYTGPFCINDSPIGYCEKPLRVICIDNELICR